MQDSNSRFFSLMVVGENPNEIVEKYSFSYQVESYIKYRYLDAKKYQDRAVKSLKMMLDNWETIGMKPTLKEALVQRLNSLSTLTPFEYYRELTDGMYYDENGNAISQENPNAKYNTCRIGRNFALPLKLNDGSESYSALAKDINWEAMNGANKAIYEAAWELVIEGREPKNDEEKQIVDAMHDKQAYFENFKSKEAYATYSSAYWNYAYADKDVWLDLDDEGDEEKWINEFYRRFIEKLKPNDLVSIYECSINS